MVTEKILELKNHINALTSFLRGASINDLKELNELESSIFEFEFSRLGSLCTAASQEMFLSFYAAKIFNYYEKGFLGIGKIALSNFQIEFYNENEFAIYDNKNSQLLANFRKAENIMSAFYYGTIENQISFSIVELQTIDGDLHERVSTNQNWHIARPIIHNFFSELQNYIIESLSKQL